MTTGSFTPSALDFGRNLPVDLVAGEELAKLVAEAQSVKTPARGRVTVMRPCPTCGKPMVKRVARKGGRAGLPFWGCSGYPDCQTTREVA